MTDWGSLKVVDLKAELTARGLSIKGLKADLVQRLADDDAATAAQTDQEPAVEDEIADKTALPAALDAANEESLDTSSKNTELIDPTTAAATATSAEDSMMQSEDTSVAPNQSERPTSSQEPAPTTTNIMDPVQPNQPAFQTPLPTLEVTVDEQKRKRRSITPQPSSKRARHDEERSAGNHEIAVEFEADNGTLLSPRQPPNTMEHKQDALEDVKMRDVSLEATGEDAYAKRVAIAGSYQLRENSAPRSQGSLPAESEDDAYATRAAPAGLPESAPAASPQYSGPSVDEIGEGANAKRVAIANSPQLDSTSLPQHVAGERSPVARSRSPQPKQEPYEHTRRDVSQQSQAPINSTEVESSPPSSHPPTSALYIRELMRPLKAETMEDHILGLISSSTDDERDADPICGFYLDQIRTHAFVSLTSISAAQLVRAALHNQVWPDERNRKALWVDFIPAENVKDWIEREETAPRGARWEVVYEQDHDRVVAIHREADFESKALARPPPTGPAAAAGPVYPGVEGAPRGPRGGSGRSTFQIPNTRQTEVRPHLSYTPKDEDVARRRITDMRSYYARDPPPDLGKDYHRFTFETADSFVDRGVEVFIGIRPPHRQKEHEDRLRREGPGTTGSSRFPEPRRDDYRTAPRPRFTDEDRFSRQGDGRRSERPEWPSRNRGFRNDRGSGRFRGEDPYRYRPGGY